MIRYFKKLKRIANKDRQFFKDAVLNMFAFAIYIGAQQIILLPLLAKLSDEKIYANIIIFITVMNVFCNVFGGQLGVAHQLQKSQYTDDSEAEKKDFSLLMATMSGFIILAMPMILIWLRFDKWTVVCLTATSVISNFRLYIRYFFRINSAYVHIIVQNLLYLFGIGCGLVAYQTFGMIWIPLFLSEAFALIYTLFSIPRGRIKFGRSGKFKETVNRYAGLAAADALTNTVTLIDKLLVYPLLGAYSLAVYHSGSATGKMATLVTNPLNEVILVKLSKAKEKGVSSLLKTVVVVSIISTVVLFIIILPVIYIFSSLLYEQYLQDIKSIIVLLSIGSSVGIISSVIKSFILRYASSRELTNCYVLNIICLAVGGYIGALLGKLLGFAISMVVGRVALLVSFILVLIKHAKKRGNCDA